MPFKVLIFTLIISLGQLSQSKDFPKVIPRCHPEDSDCLVKVTNEIIHNHPNGYSDLNLDNLEPFRIGAIKIKGDSSKPVNFNLEMTNLSLTGYSTMHFTKFSGFKKDPKDLRIKSEASCDHVELTGKYNISGNMLVIPIIGHGDITCKIDGIHIKTLTKMKVELRDGKEYIKVDASKTKARADGMTMKLTNLFNGDKVLGENMNKILNDNWKALWDELEPSFNEQLRKINEKTIDNVLNSFPYKDIFIIDE